MLAGNYEEIQEVKAVKPASAVMFAAELVSPSYLSLAAPRVSKRRARGNKAPSGVRLSAPSSDLSLQRVGGHLRAAGAELPPGLPRRRAAAEPDSGATAGVMNCEEFQARFRATPNWKNH